MNEKAKVCPDCKNPMTLLLYSYKCDWCDGTVEEEWEDASCKTTEPLFRLQTADCSLDVDLEPEDPELEDFDPFEDIPESD